MRYINDKNRAGWDDLYEQYFEEINKVIEDNIKQKHNKKLVEELFKNMLIVLEKAKEKMSNLEGDKEKKKPWFEKLKNIVEYAKNAHTTSKKVITINMVDQFLRSTY